MPIGNTRARSELSEFGFIKAEERYDSVSFGNFFIVLSAKEFLLRYVNDRSYLTIEIAAQADSLHWYDLSFVRNYIYRGAEINSDDQPKDNNTRIEELNDFIRQDFALIVDLFNEDNYPDTKSRIDELLRKEFKRRFP